MGTEEEGGGGKELQQLEHGMPDAAGRTPQCGATEVVRDVDVTVRQVVVPQLGREEGVQAEVTASWPGEHEMGHRIVVKRPHQHGGDGRHVRGGGETNGRGAGTGLHSVRW